MTNKVEHVIIEENKPTTIEKIKNRLKKIDPVHILVATTTVYVGVAIYQLVQDVRVGIDEFETNHANTTAADTPNE